MDSKELITAVVIFSVVIMIFVFYRLYHKWTAQAKVKKHPLKKTVERAENTDAYTLIRAAIEHLDSEPRRALDLLERLESLTYRGSDQELQTAIQQVRASAYFQMAIEHLDSDPQHTLDLLERLESSTHRGSDRELQTAIQRAKFAYVQKAIEHLDSDPQHTLDLLERLESSTHRRSDQELQTAIQQAKTRAYFQVAIEYLDNEPQRTLDLLERLEDSTHGTENQELRTAIQQAKIRAYFQMAIAHLDSEPQRTLDLVERLESLIQGTENQELRTAVQQVRTRAETLRQRSSEDISTEADEPSIVMMALVPKPIRVGQIILIAEGTPLPVQSSVTFYLQENQGNINFPVFEGEDLIGEIKSDIDPNLPIGTPIELVMTYEIDYLIACKVIIGSNVFSQSFDSKGRSTFAQSVAGISSSNLPPLILTPRPPLKNVQFTCYYPNELQATSVYGLYVYAHLPEALDPQHSSIQEDVKKYVGELGGKIPIPKTAKQSAYIQPRTPITIIPECDKLEFNPPSLTKKWYEPWTRFEFDFKTVESLENELTQCRISILMEGIEIAHINLAMEILPAQVRDMHTIDIKPTNPLASAKFARSAPTKMYNRIFVSYSRKDRQVVEAYRLAQLALGNEVFVDTYSIRTGEDWRAALANAIDEADIFQLFWSKNSAESSNVRDEWDYALKYKCSESRCVEYIRPVYWQQPIPATPPQDLAHLNFRYVPLAQEKEME